MLAGYKQALGFTNTIVVWAEFENKAAVIAEPIEDQIKHTDYVHQHPLRMQLDM